MEDDTANEEENKKSELYEHIKDSKQHYDAQTLDVTTAEQQEQQPIIRPENESHDSDVDDDDNVKMNDEDEKLEVNKKMYRFMRKLVFGVSNQVRHKPPCTASEYEISDLESRGIALSTYVGKTKALITFVVTAQLICAFVFAYAKSRFSHEASQMYLKDPKFLDR